MSVFSILNQSGGQTYAVHSPKSDSEFAQVFDLNRQGRVNAFGPADYRTLPRLRGGLRPLIRALE